LSIEDLVDPQVFRAVDLPEMLKGAAQGFPFGQRIIEQGIICIKE